MLFYIQSSTFRLFYEVWPTVLIKVVEHKNNDQEIEGVESRQVQRFFLVR